MAEPVGKEAALVELRVLEGPNLYFPRAAIKLTLDVSALARPPRPSCNGSVSGSASGHYAPVRR